MSVVTKENFKLIIQADLYRYTQNISSGSFLRCLANSPGFRYTFLLRKCSLYKGRAAVRFWFYRLLLQRYRYKYGFDISYQSPIGKGFYLGHFGLVVINPKVKIGENVNIAQGVTLGIANRGDRAGVPEIGDRVWIGAHAVIVGGVKVGEDALIAPGAYVNFDVPANAVVIGNPGKVVSYKGSDGYVNRTLEV